MTRARRILVVEDDDQYRDVLRLALGAAGFEVDVASRGDLGWEAYQANRPDLVILDSRMPGLTGPEVCARIRAQPTEVHVPVLFLTAVADLDAKVSHLDVGADDFLDKSVENRELLARVRAHLRMRDLHAEVVEGRRRLEELDRLKATLLASVSHELRTPLHGIRSYVGLLGEGIYGPLNDEQAAALAGIEDCARVLGSMIDALLTLGQLEAGLHTLRIEPLAPAEAVERAMAAVLPVAAQKDLSLVLEAEGAPERIDSDRAVIHQILTSLLGNAVRYTDAGEVRVTVRAVPGPTPLEVAIRDTGRGIDEEHLHRLLDLPVHRMASQPTPGPVPGKLGFGLAIVQRLLELVGGTLEIRSRVGVGTTAIVRFAMGN